MKTNVILFISSFVYLGFAFSPAEGIAGTGCPATLRVIQNEIANSHGRATRAFITANMKRLPFKVDISTASPSAMPGKPRFAVILLDGDYMPNTEIMSNKSLLRSLAKTILRACSDVASVKFNWMWWTEGISLQKNGQLS